MNKWLITPISLLIFLVVGCNDDNNQLKADEILKIKEEFKSQISVLESQLKEKDNKINALQGQIDALQESTKLNDPLTNEYVNEIYNKTEMIEQLVKHLPMIKQREGYIKDIIDDNNGLFLSIDYAKFVGNDGYSPNNFHIENENEEYVKVKADKDLKSFILEGTILHPADGDHFRNSLKEYKRFFNLYFFEDRLILAVEHYLP